MVLLLAESSRDARKLNTGFTAEWLRYWFGEK
jgi:hypothetical protein